MICRNCGLDIEDDCKVCPDCGVSAKGGKVKAGYMHEGKYVLSEEERQRIIAEESLRNSIRPKHQTSCLTSILNFIICTIVFGALVIWIATKIFSK